MLKINKLNKNILIIIGGGIALFFLTMLTTPIADDWIYLSSPKIVSEHRLAFFRRLFDILIGLFNQKYPETFPWFNRILIVSSHTVCAVFLYKISKEILAVRANISLVFALLFLIGGNAVLTVVNYDCFNQTGSLMFGAMGIYFFTKAKSIAKKYIIYFASCILALCVKESGIVYFAIIPLFGFIKSLNDDNFNLKAEMKTLVQFCIPGFICALLYYFSPIIQSEKLWVYGTENIPIKGYVIGTILRLFFSYTQLYAFSIRNPINVLMGNIPLSPEIISTFSHSILPIPILLLSFIIFMNHVKNKSKNALVFLLLVLLSIIVFTPTLISNAGGSIWNRNCIVFFTNLAFCYLLNAKRSKVLNLCIIMFAITSIISCSMLLHENIQTCIRQEKAIQLIKSKYDQTKKISTYKVFNLNVNKAPADNAYPYKLYSMQQIFELGRNMISIFGYDAKYTSVSLTNDKFEYSENPGNSPEYIELNDIELLEYAQNEAQKSVDSGNFDLAIVLLPTDEFYIYQAER